MQAMISAIDKAAKCGIIHKNAANRRKARLNKLLAASRRKAIVGDAMLERHWSGNNRDRPSHLGSTKRRLHISQEG